MNKWRTVATTTANIIKEYAESGKRFDGRGLENFRELKIIKNVSSKAEGSVKVKLGETEVVVGVKLGVSEPYEDSPNKGNLMVTAEMLPLSSPRFESGPPKIEAIEWARVTDRGIRESGMIDLEKLCIIPGEKVWTVYVDIYSINDDGNLMDAATIGAIAALKIARIPKYDKENNKILYDEPSDEKVPLTDVVPVAVSVHKLGRALLVDPTREEEDVSECRLTMSSSNGTISSLQKSKSQMLDSEEIKKMFEISERVSRKLLKKIEEAIE